MKRDGKDEPFDRFFSAALHALSNFAEQEYRALARKVRYDLRRYPPSFIYGEDFRPRHLWDEYCFEVQEGPTSQLEWSWERTIQPHVMHRLEMLPSTVAVLLTMASQRTLDELDHQDGKMQSDELISRGIWSALRELADDDATRRSGTREGGAFS